MSWTTRAFTVASLGIATALPCIGYHVYQLRASPLYQEALDCLVADEHVAAAIGRPIKFAPYPIPGKSTVDRMDILFEGKNYAGCLHASCVPEEGTGRCVMDYLVAVANNTRVRVKFPREVKEEEVVEAVEEEAESQHKQQQQQVAITVSTQGGSGELEQG